MTKIFRDILKAAAAHNGARAAHTNGFYAVLRRGKRVVWHGETQYLIRDHGADAKQMAMDEANAALNCDNGSLLAEQLQDAVDKNKTPEWWLGCCKTTETDE